jgi:hypothetical protein
MTSYSPSAPPIDDYEIENIPYAHEFAVNSNLVVEINDNIHQTNWIKSRIFHIILYFLFLSLSTFIIYEHHETIGLYLSYFLPKLF